MNFFLAIFEMKGGCNHGLLGLKVPLGLGLLGLYQLRGATLCVQDSPQQQKQTSQLCPLNLCPHLLKKMGWGFRVMSISKTEAERR